MSRPEADSSRSARALLTLAALGVVFGDIGTSPLYAVKETFAPGRGIPLTDVNILGGLSTIFWSLMLVVSLKYVVLVMRADNRREGGTIALLALARSAVGNAPRMRLFVTLSGLLGAALFFGETVLTPAISVISAVEGLEVGTAAFKPYVVPITLAILVGLFTLQSLGTAKVGLLFGPICVLWFLLLGASGLWNIVLNTEVLHALDPRYTIGFLTNHGFASFIVLGAVLLALTGAEALYADMGHFGKWPIRICWFGLVLPALVLNYFGQGALLLRDPSAISNPFYLAFPPWALYPMVGLATVATVIASQASITGTFSIARQAIQLGFLPRMTVVQTSARERGQIYIPSINWLLLVCVVGAVIGFGSSSNLAHAYGVALTGTMLVTTILTFFVIRFAWGYPLWLCVFASGFFIIIDVAFFSSAMFKTFDGGWFPLLIGGAVFTVMITWHQGRGIMFQCMRSNSVPLQAFLDSLFVDPPQRVPGTAIFLTATPELTPNALLHNLSHNKVLHERVIFLTAEVTEEPWVPFDKRVTVEKLGNHCWRMNVRFGFMNEPDVALALELAGAAGLEIEMMSTSFFLSRETVVPVGQGQGMALWRERLFAMMARNAGNAADYFKLPTNRVIELGTKVEI